MRIVFRKSLNRYYDEDSKKIVSKRVAKRWLKDHRFTRSMNKALDASRLRKSHQPFSHKRPSYKKLYLDLKAKDRVLRKKNMFPRFHPFMINRTKHHLETPKTVLNDVREWNKNHEGKLFVVSELGTDGNYIVRACGKVTDLEAAGFGARDLVPELIGLFQDGYQDN